MKVVQCIETGKCFKTTRSAAKSVNRSHSNIIRAIKFGYVCAGYTWKYLNLCAPRLALE